MSWIDKVRTDFTITTGDGKSYVPSWLNAGKSIEYNIAEFDFKELAGTLVKRGTPRGTRYAIELYFQGEDHLDTAVTFETSAANPAPWTIAHPYYGRILVQPVNLTFDNSDYNVTRITGGIIETISETPDIPVVSAPDKIMAGKADTDAALAASYVQDVPAPKVSDIKGMIGTVSGTYNAALSSIREAVDVEAFTNAYNGALAAARNADTNTLGAITAIQTMLSLPLQFNDTVVNRLDMLGNMLNYLAGTIPGIGNLAGRKLYENTGAAILSSMIAAAIYKFAGSYPNRSSVLSVITGLVNSYNSYMANLNGLQSPNGGFPGAYIPAATGITLLSQLFGYGVNALLAIAAGSRQERSFFLEEDTNLIMLAYRLYGLKDDDSTIDAVIEENGIGLTEMLIVKKGRKIVYYV